MKKISIYCSTDHESGVVSVLDREGVRSYMVIEGATGNLIAPPGEIPRTESFEALLIVVPAVEESRAEAIVTGFERYLDGCSSDGHGRVCLHLTTSPVERVLGQDRASLDDREASGRRDPARAPRAG